MKNMSTYFIIENNCLIAYRGHQREIVIPNGVVKIAEDVFKDNREIISVRFPQGLLEIGAGAFSWCANLSCVMANKELEHIEKDVFIGTPFYKFYCENENEWQEDFLILGKCLVKGRRNLRYAEIPEGLVQIVADCFSGCVLLKTVSFSSSIKKIGWRAFSECTGIDNLKIPGSVETIGWRAFKGCARLKAVTIDQGVKEIEAGVFSGCRSLESIEVPKSVINIGSWIFFGCTSLRKVAIKGQIESLGDLSFSGCSNLTDVELPEGIKEIGVDAFWEAIALKQINFPDSIKRIGRRAFGGCRYLKTVRLPSCLEELGEEAFAGCWEIRSVTIPDQITEIREMTFYGCEHLEHVVMGKNTRQINRRAFAFLTRLEEINFPESIEILEDEAFFECANLKRVILNKGLRQIGNRVFYECQLLKKINMPEEIQMIGADVFKGCKSLTDPNGLIIIDHTLYGFDGIASGVVIPGKIKKIGSGAFKCKSGIISIDAGKNVIKIGKGAFTDCFDLQTIHLNQVAEIEARPFKGCSQLKMILAPSIRPDSFADRKNRIAAILGFCSLPERYDYKMGKVYEKEIQNYLYDLLLQGIEENLNMVFGYFCENELIKEDQFSEILERVQKLKRMEMVAMLLNYKQKVLSEHDPFDVLLAD